MGAPAFSNLAAPNSFIYPLDGLIVNVISKPESNFRRRFRQARAVGRFSLTEGMITFVAKVSMVLVCFYQTAVQAQSWQHFSTPDNSLSVELPAKPKVLKQKNESLEVIFKYCKSAYSYAVDLGFESDPEILFSVLLLSKAMNNRDFDTIVNSNMLWIAGDDKHFSKESDVIVSGLHGREFFFEKGQMSGRALFINGGTHIYYLMFQTDTEPAKSADVVARIFNSFHPNKRSRVSRNVQQALGADSSLAGFFVESRCRAAEAQRSAAHEYANR